MFPDTDLQEIHNKYFQENSDEVIEIMKEMRQNEIEYSLYQNYSPKKEYNDSRIKIHSKQI